MELTFLASIPCEQRHQGDSLRASSLRGRYCEKSRARASGNREETQERGAEERKESLQRSLINFHFNLKPQETAKCENFRRNQEICLPPVSVSYADSLRTYYYTIGQRQHFFLLFLRPYLLASLTQMPESLLAGYQGEVGFTNENALIFMCATGV